MHRREFLKTASLASLAAATPLRARAATPTDVIIVGAGLAGLHAAWLLEQQGMRVTLLEARGRAGGRVFTLDDVPGKPEAGGNAIGTSYARVLDHVRRLDLELGPMRVRSDPGASETIIHYRDRFIAEDAWSDSPLNPFTGAERGMKPWELQWPFYIRSNPLEGLEDWRSAEFAKYDVPLYDYVAEAGYSNEAIQLAFDRCQLYGTGAFDVSALGMFQIINLATYVRSKIGPEQYAIKGGNQRLPEALAASLDTEILYGHPISAVRQGRNGVAVHCANGAVFRAGRALITAPPPALRHVVFDPVLPRLQSEGISQLGYAVSFQVHFRPLSRFWEQDGMPLTMWTDGPIGRLAGLYYDDDSNDPTSIITFVNGARALSLDRMSQPDAVRYVLELLASIRPSTRGQLAPIRVQSWQQDPYAGGMYSAWKPGQITRIADPLAAPTGKVHFAGEHTARINRGMEGAMESGERAAIEILTALDTAGATRAGA